MRSLYLQELILCKSGFTTVLQVLVDGTVNIGCGVAYLILDGYHSIVAVCVYDVTGDSGNLPQLKDGETLATDFRVLEEYESDTTKNVQGRCPAQ